MRTLVCSIWMNGAKKCGERDFPTDWEIRSDEWILKYILFYSTARGVMQTDRTGGKRDKKRKIFLFFFVIRPDCWRFATFSYSQKYSPVLLRGLSAFYYHWIFYFILHHRLLLLLYFVLPRLCLGDVEVPSRSNEIKRYMKSIKARLKVESFELWFLWNRHEILRRFRRSTFSGVKQTSLSFVSFISDDAFTFGSSC